MDRNARSILAARVAVLVLTALAITAALIVPFNVDQPAAIDYTGGMVEIDQPGSRPPIVLTEDNDPHSLKIGHTLRLAPDSTATLFLFKNGQVVLTGPSEFTLVEAYRRATALGHVLDSQASSRDYALTIRQNSGTAHYRFAHSSPSFEKIEITIQLPDRTYIPDSPCWIIDVSVEGTSQITPEPCPS